MSVVFRSVGTVGGPEFLLRRGGGRLRPLRLPVTVAVIERPDGLVLIDAGWSRSTCAWPERDPGRARKFFVGIDVKPEDAIASQLLSLGYSPGDVKHVVATHLHADHVGGAVDFPSATVHCSEAEWSALSLGLRGGYDLRAYELPRVRQHALREAGALGFSASKDLFGDGTMLLLGAPGHTRGSTAVAVRLSDGWLLHAGDAAMFASDYHADESKPPSAYMAVISWSVAAQRESYRALLEAETAHGARVVPSHDPAVFETLPTTRETAWSCAWTKGRNSKRPKQK